MAEDITRPQRSRKRSQPVRTVPAATPAADRDAGDPVAIGLMIGIITIIALLTLALLVSIP